MLTLNSIFILLFLIPIIFCQQSRRRVDYDSVSQFLFHNSKICGDPFSDAVWLPVLDLCQIECDITTQYCVENEELTQQCKTLPDDCQKLLLRSIKQIQRRLRKQSNN